MKPTATKQIHHIGVSQEDVRMAIDQKSLVHIMSLLTDLYSDPILAIMREYSTNAWDANVEAGNSAPILVTLPNVANMEFKVQDHGVGLSVNDIREVYALYGASTKRDSNDVNGMLGLGCKSGLTYALTFTVVGVKNGVQTVAMVTKDTDGSGTIKILDTAATDEPNGVTVQVPVQQKDISAFHDKAAEFYQHWPEGTVLVDGEEPDRSWLDDAIVLDDDVMVLKQGYKSRIIMGNVAYPWPSEDRHGFQHSMIVRVPIGTLDFPPSREAIQWTDLSKATTQEAFKFVQDRFPLALRDQCRKAPTPFAQAKILNEWRYVGQGVTKGVLGEFRDNLAVEHDRSRVVWRWNRYDNGAAKTLADWRWLMDEKDHLVVTHFPFKALSPSHRRRLSDLSGWYGPGTPNNCEVPKNALILPDDATIGVLEGRRNTISWDDVVAITPEPPREVRAARSQKGALYTVTKGDDVTESDLLDPKDGKIIWRRRLDRRQYNSQDNLVGLFPECQIVQLYERQIEKFLRLHPKAVEIDKHYQAEQAKAKKALTQDDKDCVGATDTIWHRLNRTHVFDKALDPDIQRIHKLATHSTNSKTFQRAKLLGVAPTTTDSKLYAGVLARYPLLQHINSYNLPGELAADMTLYLNTKYEQTTTPQPDGGTKQ